MAELLTLPAPPTPLDVAHRLDGAVRRLAARLGTLLAGLDRATEDGGLSRFLCAFGLEDPGTGWDGSCLDLPPAGTVHPVDRLVSALGLNPGEIDILLLAGAPHQHEGVAWVMRQLHPLGLPWATTGLASALAESGGLPGLGGRAELRAALATGPLARSGSVVLEGEGPYAERSLRCPGGLWEALHADDAWPLPRLQRPTPPWGLDRWLARPETVAARAALARREPCAVVATSDRPEATATRLAALVEAAGCDAELLRTRELDDRSMSAVALHGLMAGVVPVLAVSSELVADLPAAGVPWPVVLSLPRGSVATTWPRLQLLVAAAPLDRDSRLEAATAALPELGRPAHPVGPATVEPSDLAMAAADLRAGARLNRSGVTANGLTRAIDVRTAHAVPAGAVLVHPAAGWEDLVLPTDRLAQLREAVNRMREQAVVFDRWGFLPGRTGRRGLRLLFSGPPGTGKTLAAEVVAGTLGRDLLVVDISRMVSKWIGETEKNLAAAFDAAEQGGAALLFDEADAIFGKRTEVGDARDRYANLETAYLLSRLERFDGLAVLATNLRQNLDMAFARRLEFIVPFDLPDAAQRLDLWRRHIPLAAPVEPGVTLERLAALYPLPGALIRNAAVAAAFLAAAEDASIATRHLVHAVEREYVKAGQAFPGPPTEAR